MHRLVDCYSGDLDHVMVQDGMSRKPFSKLSLKKAFDFIRKIPYRRDTPPKEVIARPAHILNNRKKGMDCKKKAILIAAYCKRRGIPCRFVASSRKKNRRIHHVFPQVNLGGIWCNLDATYPHYKPFEVKPVTKAEVLHG